MNKDLMVKNNRLCNNEIKVLPKQMPGAALLLVFAARVDAGVGVVAEAKLLLISPNERRAKGFLVTCW